MANSTLKLSADVRSCISSNMRACFIGLPLLACIGHVTNILIIKRHKLLTQPKYLILFYVSLANFGTALTFLFPFASLPAVPAGKICTYILDVVWYISPCCFLLSEFLAVLLSLNQFLAVAYAIYYNSIVHLNRIRTLAGGCCILAVLLKGLTLVEPSKGRNKEVPIQVSRSHYLLMFTVAIVSTIAIAANLIYVQYVSRKQLARMLKDGVSTKFWKNRRRRSYGTATMNSIPILLMLAFQLLYLTLAIRDKRDNIRMLRIGWAILLLFLAVNPVLYMLTFHELRKIVSAGILACMCTRHPSSKQLAAKTTLLQKCSNKRMDNNLPTCDTKKAYPTQMQEPPPALETKAEFVHHGSRIRDGKPKEKEDIDKYKIPTLGLQSSIPNRHDTSTLLEYSMQNEPDQAQFSSI